jgi:hypothetical protein
MVLVHVVARSTEGVSGAQERRQGLSVKLLKAAVDFARSKGARIVEGYPTQPGRDLPPGWGYMGIVSAFQRAGFSEVARPSKTRRIMRYTLRPPRGRSRSA